MLAFRFVWSTYGENLVGKVFVCGIIDGRNWDGHYLPARCVFSLNIQTWNLIKTECFPIINFTNKEKLNKVWRTLINPTFWKANNESFQTFKSNKIWSIVIRLTFVLLSITLRNKGADFSLQKTITLRNKGADFSLQKIQLNLATFSIFYSLLISAWWWQKTIHIARYPWGTKYTVAAVWQITTSFIPGTNRGYLA